MIIPFPFGLEEGCFANKRFRLNCTPDHITVLETREAQFIVTNVSVEDGTLTVSNLLNNTKYGREILITQGDQYGDTMVYGPVEDRFDFSLEYNIIIKWAVTNLTCDTDIKKNATYACRSIHSDCLNVTHANIFMGYRCKCLPGFQGNPYIRDGCKGLFLFIPLLFANV
jgi:hypothetical protein